MDALQRRADRLERNSLGAELGHPLNWQTMELDELRALAANLQRRQRTRRERSQSRAPTRPKAQPATGTHATENYNLNQGLMDQIQTEGQGGTNTQESDHSAETYHEDQPDWGSGDRDRAY